MTDAQAPRRDDFNVSWSAEDQEFVGTCARYPSLSWLAPCRDDALAGIRRLVRAVDKDLRS